MSRYIRVFRPKAQSKPVSVIVALSIVFVFQAASGQEGVGASGNTYVSSVASVSVSTGLVAYEYETSLGIAISQGVQQVFEDSTTAVFDVESANRQLILAYPNPCSDILNIEAPGFVAPRHYQLVTIGGMVLKHGTFDDNIDIHDVPQGVYTVSVRDARGIRKRNCLIVVMRGS